LISFIMATSKKRSAAMLSSEDCGLRNALQIAEKLKKPVSAKVALSAFAKVKSYRAAVVVIASKMKKTDLALEEMPEEKQQELSDEELVALVKLQEAGLYRCCRGPAIGKKLDAARIIQVGKPIMEKCPKPKKLSQISEIVELMLDYTQVELGMTALGEWDEYDSWVEKQLTRIPLFTDILDPTFLIIRGPLGAAAPAGILAYLNSLLVGGNRLDGGLSANPIHPVRRNAAEAPIPDLYQFADHQDAGIARAALIGWASDHGHGNLDMVRFTTGVNGFAWM
jgi:hypothetical protein